MFSIIPTREAVLAILNSPELADMHREYPDCTNIEEDLPDEMNDTLRASAGWSEAEALEFLLDVRVKWKKQVFLNSYAFGKYLQGTDSMDDDIDYYELLKDTLGDILEKILSCQAVKDTTTALEEIVKKEIHQYQSRKYISITRLSPKKKERNV